MQTLDKETLLYIRAAIRECIEYGEHGLEIEVIDGQFRCFNCEGAL